ncbi:MAG TPA: zf-HC2 domain-containing protein [Egibacteraceae bacterium]|nr:zf-HC2 domain-containing protein [Egibacteraceae bacterium]
MNDPTAAKNRVCREVQSQLPDLVAGALPWWRRRLVTLHLRRCQDCQEALQRQRAVARGLDELEAAASAGADATPPEGLLDSLLTQAEQPGLRGRAAVPARGAVSGARPELSVALLVIGAAVGTAVGYAAWRAVRATRGRYDHDGA